MNRLIAAITSGEPEIRDQSLDSLCAGAPLADLLADCAALDQFRRSSDNLYERVRALFFLYAIHRFYIPRSAGANGRALIPFPAYTNLLRRRFQESIDTLLAEQAAHGPSASLSSALAAAYRALGFQTLADQVRRSVRSVRGNQWMFRTGHPADYALRLRPELLHRPGGEPLFPVLREATPVRMDLTHSGWSDIFFLGMDYPEAARVVNISIDLTVRGDGAAAPRPPVEAYFRVIDQPVLRLTSVDLKATTDIGTIAEVFDFARDYLGLLKAAVIASGLVPSGMEGSPRPLSDLLRQLVGAPGYGIEIVSKVNDIPKGSRLAVSTSLLSCLIAVCMRATRQIHALTGEIGEEDRRLVAARAILGEWLGGSGGGWQDSGGVWPGIKLIHGVAATEDDPEYGVSRGCLLPRHRVFGRDEVSAEARRQLQDSLVLVHGGMAQDVGPILEMVTEKYLLRSEAEWAGRREAIRILDEVLDELRRGDIPAIGNSTQRNFDGPIQTIIPWAGKPLHGPLDPRGARGDGQRFFRFLDAGRHVRRRHGISVLAAPQGGSAGPDGRDHALGQTPARKLRAVRHGAGSLRFRHQRAGDGGGAARSRRRAASRGVLYAHRAGAAAQRCPAAFAGAPRRTRPVQRRVPRDARNLRARSSNSSITCCRRRRARTDAAAAASTTCCRSTASTARSMSASRRTCGQDASDWRKIVCRPAAGSSIRPPKPYSTPAATCRAAIGTWGARRWQTAPWRWFRWRAASEAAGPRAPAS